MGGWGWVAGSIEIKAISASNLKLKLKLNEAELGKNKCSNSKVYFFSFFILLQSYGLNNEGNKGTSIFVYDKRILKFSLNIFLIR